MFLAFLPWEERKYIGEKGVEAVGGMRDGGANETKPNSNIAKVRKVKLMTEFKRWARDLKENEKSSRNKFKSKRGTRMKHSYTPKEKTSGCSIL